MALNFSFSKKGEAEPVAPPVWHPDFRDVTRLPDTKVVRTTFFVNTAAIAVAIALLLVLGYREYDLRNLNEQIATAQREIDTNAKANTEAIKLSKEFADEQKKLAEVVAFRQMPIGPTEFVALLGQTLPKEVVIESVEMNFAMTGGLMCLLRAQVAGSSDQASGAASRYVDTLRANPRLAAVFESITLTNLNRNANGAFLSVDIALKVKTEAKK